jgi:hypothetical protein
VSDIFRTNDTQRIHLFFQALRVALGESGALDCCEVVEHFN